MALLLSLAAGVGHLEQVVHEQLGHVDSAHAVLALDDGRLLHNGVVQRAIEFGVEVERVSDWIT